MAFPDPYAVPRQPSVLDTLSVKLYYITKLVTVSKSNQYADGACPLVDTCKIVHVIVTPASKS